jgi:phosphoserine aminotransferase
MILTEQKSTFNFNAGPSALPLAVLENAQQELLNFRKTGMSIMELSHRSKIYEEVHNQAIDRLKNLLSITDDYEVLFLQGGGSLQFSMIPTNFLQPGQSAGYVLTGAWAEKAFSEAKLFGDAYQAASTKDSNYRRLPKINELSYNEDDNYLHITSNNTIYGTQWKDFPDTGSVPLITDMSSDILSTQININQFDLIYAGAQKNLGAAGVTVVIIRKELMERSNQQIPTMLKYSIHAKNNSLYNTPPTFGIYMLGEVLGWLQEIGGLDEISRRNEEKANLIYSVIDNSNDFYIGHANQEDRSLMNITFRLADRELEKKFLTEASKEGFVGLNGHRSVGGCRASTYNAVPYESCKALSEFMIKFQRKSG